MDGDVCGVVRTAELMAIVAVGSAKFALANRQFRSTHASLLYLALGALEVCL